ncbi:hypothetical protein ACHAXR_013129 [Thalassiosira sp. AJA248-18]
MAMNYLYDYDDDVSSCCSAEIEGGVATLVDPTLRASFVDDVINHSQDSEEKTSPSREFAKDAISEGGGAGARGGSVEQGPLAISPEHDSNKAASSDNEEDALEVSRHSDRNTSQPATSNGTSNSDQKEQIINPMAALIQNERNRRLGVRGADEDENNKNTPSSPRRNSEMPAAPISGGVLGNIRGWFGGGGGVGAGSNNCRQSTPTKPPILNSHARRSSAPVISIPTHNNSPHKIRSQMSSASDQLPPESQLGKNTSYNEEDEESSSSSSEELSSDDDDDYSSSQSSNGSNSQKPGDADLTPQERARARALRYLSNSCVDAGRKAKTASYVRGLERLDLKRKRDRYEKELEVVEAEMNKDRALIDNRERDPISDLAAKLGRELPRIQGADAGAGSVDELGDASFMSYDEYADALSADNNPTPNEEPSLWKNKEAVNVYITSLQGRLKEAVERTRSLEKRLVVLEKAGDGIVSSLCEDLAEVTGHSNKAEARYVKKGKELQRKRRREELRHRSRIKQGERHIRKLEEQLLKVSGGSNDEYTNKLLEWSDSSNGDSTFSGDVDDEDDEVLLEKKLFTITAKNEQDRDQHESERESIRRQCEQFKLRLSVARLVMEGDDNLREYIALLERLNPSTQHQRNKSTDLLDQDFSGIHGYAIPSPPPSRITRARAKLLKVTHLERIYEQRLAISKAFTDATINALEQELLDREEASQKMEVRCLNELMLIDSGIKDIVNEASDRMNELESEARELRGAIAALTAQKSISGISDMFGGNTSVEPLSKPAVTEEATPVDSQSLSDSSIDERENHAQQVETGHLSDDALSQDGNDIGYYADEAERRVIDTSVEPLSKPAVTEEASPMDSQPLSDSSIDERDKHAQQVETGHLSDDALSQDENDIGYYADETKPRVIDTSVEPSKPAGTEEASPMDSQLLSDSSIDERDNHAQQVETEHISDDALSQDENGFADEAAEAEPPNAAVGREISMHNGSSAPIDDGEEQVDTGMLSDAVSQSCNRDEIESIAKAPLSDGTDMDSVDADGIEAATCGNAVRLDHGIEDLRSSVEDMENGDPDGLSDSDSFMLANDDIVDESSLPNARGNTCDLGDTLSNDAVEIETTLCDDIIQDNHDDGILGSSDEAMENGEHEYKKSDDLNSHEVEDDSISPSRNKAMVDTESDFETGAKITSLEALEVVSNEDSVVPNGLPSSGEQEVPTQCMPKSEMVCSTDQSCPDIEENCDPSAIKSFVVENDHDFVASDPVVASDYMSEGCEDVKNETAPFLPDSNTDDNLRSDDNGYEQIIEIKDEDGNEEVKTLSTFDPQKKEVLEMLGRELKCTLAEYQTSFDLFSSGDRVEHLEYMNNLVVKIAKVGGMELPDDNIDTSERMNSWSHKDRRRSSEKERYEKKRSKKKKKKKRRRRGKEGREVVVRTDGPDTHSHSLVW